MQHLRDSAECQIRLIDDDAGCGAPGRPSEGLVNQRGSCGRVAIVGEVRGSDEEAESIRPRPVERGQSVEDNIPVTLKPAANQVGDGPGGQRGRNDGGTGAQGLTLILSITFWVMSSDLSAVTIIPSLALTSKIIA